MFAGTWALIKLILRRDRVKLPLWILLIVGSILAMIPLLRETYGDAASLETLYQAFQMNSAGAFMTGIMDGPNFGSLFTIETVVWFGAAVAIMNILLVVRHTRHNEEIGAQELILSCRVSRKSSLVAVLIVALVANLLMGAGLAVGMSGTFGASGAWLYGLSMGLFGLVFAVIAAIVVQLAESARGAIGIMMGVMGVAFMLRGIGDFLSSVNADGVRVSHMVSNFSPFGWMQAAKALSFEYWDALIIPTIFCVVGAGVAFWLLASRDLGAGILPSRKGRARASRFLKSTFGLPWKMQKNAFLGWLFGAVALAATIGVLVPEMTNVYESSETMRDFIAALGGSGAMIETFLSVMLSFAAVLALAFVIQALSRLRSEETGGYLENLLATRLGRAKWYLCNFATTMLGGLVILVLSGVVLAICTLVVSDIEVSVWEYALAGVSYWPMMWVFGGIYTLLFGLLPFGARAVTWTYYGFVAMMSWIGPLLGLDKWVGDLSIMTHIAAAPANGVEWGSLVVMLIVGVGLSAVGVWGFGRRDLSAK